VSGNGAWALGLCSSDRVIRVLQVDSRGGVKHYRDIRDVRRNKEDHHDKHRSLQENIRCRPSPACLCLPSHE
jgi:hypothetical protein